VLGVAGSPELPFSEFQKFKLQVGEESRVYFLGHAGEVRIRLQADGKDLRVDKGLKEGTWVH
ncbi:MAG: hypothetical protein AABX97_08225, partial [Candidatus Thermoplasmatota archaeon]